MTDIAKKAWLSTLDTVTTLVVLAVGAIVLWRNLAPTPATDAAPTASPQIRTFQLGAHASLGSNAAKFVLVEFTDFECTFCRHFESDVFPALEERYVATGRLRFVVMQYPLPRHFLARAASEAAVCAGQQGRYWQFHRALTSAPPPDLGWDHLDLAKRVGLSLGPFSQCRLTTGPSEVTAEATVGKQMRFDGTPGFVVGRVNAADQIEIATAFTGARPVQEFIAILDRLLGT